MQHCCGLPAALCHSIPSGKPVRLLAQARSCLPLLLCTNNACQAQVLACHLRTNLLRMPTYQMAASDACPECCTSLCGSETWRVLVLGNLRDLLQLSQFYVEGCRSLGNGQGHVSGLCLGATVLGASHQLLALPPQQRGAPGQRSACHLPRHAHQRQRWPRGGHWQSQNIPDWFGLAVGNSNQITRRRSSAAMRCQLKKLTSLVCHAKSCTNQKLSFAAACGES